MLEQYAGNLEAQLNAIKKRLEELRKHVAVQAVTLDISTDKDVTQIKIPKISLITQVLFSFTTSKILNKLKPDVCLINQYWAEFSPLLLNVPWIPIIHDVGLFYSEWAKKHRIKHVIRTQVLKKVTKQAKIIIVPSRLTAKDLQTYLNVPEHKIKIILFVVIILLIFNITFNFSLIIKKVIFCFDFCIYKYYSNIMSNFSCFKLLFLIR